MTKLKRFAKKKVCQLPMLRKKQNLEMGMISKWNDSVPSVANLKKVASILEVTVDELIGDEE